MRRQIRMKFRGEEFTISAERSGNSVIIERDGTTYTVEVVPNHDIPAQRRPAEASSQPVSVTSATQASGSLRADAASDAALSAPMTGTIKAVLAQTGDSIDEGQTVIVMEAMKMEMEVSAHRSGTVSEILCAAGDSVKEKQPLLRLA